MRTSLLIYMLLIGCCIATTSYSAPVNRQASFKKKTTTFSSFKDIYKPSSSPVTLPSGHIIAAQPFVSGIISFASAAVPMPASSMMTILSVPRQRTEKIADVERVLKEWNSHIFPAHYFW